MGASASMFSNLLLVQKRTIYSGSGSYGKTFGFGWYASAQATQRYLVATPFASAVRVWAVACESLHVPSCIMHCTPCEHTDSCPLYQLQQSSGTTHHQDWDITRCLWDKDTLATVWNAWCWVGFSLPLMVWSMIAFFAPGRHHFGGSTRLASKGGKRQTLFAKRRGSPRPDQPDKPLLKRSIATTAWLQNEAFLKNVQKTVPCYQSKKG